MNATGNLPRVDSECDAAIEDQRKRIVSLAFDIKCTEIVFGPASLKKLDSLGAVAPTFREADKLMKSDRKLAAKFDSHYEGVMVTERVIHALKMEQEFLKDPYGVTRRSKTKCPDWPCLQM